MAKQMLRRSRLTILLSLNAVAIVIAGILIAGAIGLTNGWNFHVIGTHSDVRDEEAPDTMLIDGSANSGAILASAGKVASGIGNDKAPDGELWNEKSVTMFQSADYDLCIGQGIDNPGDMYWQTSNSKVISGFYSSARTWLGYDSEKCKYPIITGTGTTTITAGTYDGERRDTIEITVVPPPIEQWQHDVLDVVNRERNNHGLLPLSWGFTCEEAAKLRAQEETTYYSHTRPSGNPWSTACPIPSSGGVSGENLAIGNAAVSPETVVNQWMNSTEHRENILNPSFTKLSVGFVFEPNLQYRTYWEQFFSNY